MKISVMYGKAKNLVTIPNTVGVSFEFKPTPTMKNDGTLVEARTYKISTFDSKWINILTSRIVDDTLIPCMITTKSTFANTIKDGEKITFENYNLEHISLD